MTEKTLFIHAGGTKTGSSAIQNFLEIHAPRLDPYGFSYANRLNIDSKYEIHSGNGVSLFMLLTSTNFTANELDNLVLSYFENRNNAICSSEIFEDFDAPTWKILIESTERLAIKLLVIYYVRNMIPFFSSMYDQGIKRHGIWQEFNEIAMTMMTWNHVQALRPLVDGVSISRMRVLHYDSHSKDLIRSFLDNLGIDNSFKVEEPDRTRIVNRSLTNDERDHIRFINKIFGEKYSTEVSNFLLNTNQSASAEKINCSKNIVDELINRYKSDLDWINSTFFTGQNVLSFHDAEPLDNQQDPLHPSTETIIYNTCSVEKQLLNWALMKLKSCENEIQNKASG